MRLGSQQFLKSCFEPSRDFKEDFNGNVLLTAFDATNVGEVTIGFSSKVLLRPATCFAKGTDSSPERMEKP